MSKLTEHIEKVTSTLASKNLPPEKMEALSTQLNMGLDEYVSFQELKSLAMMHGKLSESEAQQVYGYLGNTVEHFNHQAPAIKYVLTLLFQGLLDWKLKLQGVHA